MPIPIQYAPPMPWHRSPRARSLAIRLVIVAAIICGGIWAFRFVQQVSFLYQQHRWMHYAMLPDKVILEQGTPEASMLLKTPGYHKLQLDDSSIRAAVCNMPDSLASLPYAQNTTVVFLHRMQAAGSRQRLVYVIIDPVYAVASSPEFSTSQPAMSGPKLYAIVQKPAALRPGDRPRICTSGDSGEFVFEGGSLRLFAGQPDPADESHFTIRYLLDGKTKMIDGWLMPDDTLRLEPRR